MPLGGRPELTSAGEEMDVAASLELNRESEAHRPDDFGVGLEAVGVPKAAPLGTERPRTTLRY
jgi:hypothetical protein